MSTYLLAYTVNLRVLAQHSNKNPPRIKAPKNNSPVYGITNTNYSPLK